MNARIWGIIGGVALVLALLSPLVLGSSKKVENLFKIAEELYEHSEYKSAIIKYKEALEESKKFGVRTQQIDKDFTTLAYLKIAQCYYELGEETSDVRHYRNALIHIKEVVLDTQVTKHQEELFYLWAENLYKIGELNRSESKFFSLIERFPNSHWVPKALYTIGEITYQQDNCEKALSIFHNLITEFPQSKFRQEAESRIEELNQLCGDPDPPTPDPISQCEEMFKRASDLKKQEKAHDAYQLYTEFITQCPESKYIIDAYIGRAEIYLEAKDYINARANYEEAIHRTAEEERIRELYEAYHRTYLIPKYADRHIQRDPSDELFVKARLLRKEERWLEAAKIYEKLTNSDLSTEDTAYALYWKGRCYYEAALTDSTLFSRSIDAFKKFITDHEGRSDTIKAYYYLSLTYAAWATVSENPSKYKLTIDTVEEANTKYAQTNDNTIQGWLSRMQELKEAASIKLDDEPEPEPPDPPEPSPVALVNQGLDHFKRAKLGRATQKARQALNLDQNYSPAHKLFSEIKEAHYGRGWTFFDEGQHDKAIAEFKNALDIDSDFKEAHCHLGVIYIEKQKYTKAIQALEKAISIDEAFKEAHFNLALAHLELSEFKEAIYAANTALRIDPNYEPARMLIKFIAD